MVYPIFRFWVYSIRSILIKRIKGVEHIPNKIPFIIVSNHEKLIDPLYILYPILRKLNKKIHFLAAPTWWFLGEKICRQWAGCIPLFNPTQAYREAKELIEAGEIVSIFPEGHLYKKVRNPKTGAVRLAIETNTQILPIGIVSSYLPLKSKINIGKPIHLKKGKSVEKQAFSLMKHIYQLKNQ